MPGNPLAITLAITLAVTPAAVPAAAAPVAADPCAVYHGVVDREAPALLMAVEFAGRPWRFLVDTGATFSVFDSGFVERLGMPLRPQTFRTPAGTLRLPLYRPPPGLTAAGGAAVLAHDFAPVRRATGLPIYGVLGMAFLRHRVLDIDGDSGRFLILRCRPADLSRRARRLPLTTNSWALPSLSARIGGQRVDFVVDTGELANGGLHHVLFDRLLQGSELRPLPKVLRLTLAGPHYRPMGRLDRLELGDLRYRDLIFARQEANTLGLGFLLRHRAVLDFPSRTLYLEPGETFGARAAFNYTGISLERRGDRVEVFRVAPDSPAAVAGILPGDELRRIDGQAVTGLGLFQVRRLLRGEGRTLRLDLLRRGRGLPVDLSIPVDGS